MLLMLAVLPTAADGRPGWLGLSYTFHGRDQGPAIQWLLVRGLERGGPADKGGVKLQDVVVAINGKRIAFANAQAMLDAIGRIRPRENVRLTVVRGGKEQILTIRATEMTPAQYERWKMNYEIAKRPDK
jgi:S1-C subfamily serine protease